MSLLPSSIPGLWKLARLQFDDVRQQPVLLYPEGVVLLNATGASILELCDGHRVRSASLRETSFVLFRCLGYDERLTRGVATRDDLPAAAHSGS